MIFKNRLAIALAGLALTLTAAAGTARAGLVFNNSLTDLGLSVMYNDQGFVEIGDQITLDGTGRSLDLATLQLFNRGSAGTFDAIFRLYLPGAPVGAELLAVSRSNLAAPDSGVFDLTFSLFGQVVPDELIFTLEVSNLSAGVDLGLNLFDPPTVGFSDSSFFLAREHAFDAQAGPPGNLYLRMEAANVATVPEPRSLLLLAGPMVAVLRLASRRNRPAF